MSLIKEKDRAQLEKRFQLEMKRDVTIEYFSRQSILDAAMDAEEDDEESIQIGEAHQLGLELYQEVASLTPRLTVNFHDLDTQEGQLAAQTAGLADDNQLPAAVYRAESLVGRSRFFGLPTGYEFATLIQNVIDLSTGQTELSPETRQTLAGINKPVHLMVFVTPT